MPQTEKQIQMKIEIQDRKMSRRVVGWSVIRCQLTDGLLSPDQSDWVELSQLEAGFRLSKLDRITAQGEK